MAQLAFREISNINYTSQVWTIAIQYHGSVNCVEWNTWLLDSDFWQITQWSINHYGTVVYMFAYDYTTNSMKLYNFDSVDNYNTENGWNRAAWVRRNNYIYMLWTPTTWSNRKLYIRRYIIGTVANASWVFELELDTVHGTKITAVDFLFATWTANTNTTWRIFRHNTYHILYFCGTSNGRWISINTITFNISDEMLITRHNLYNTFATAPISSTNNIQNFDTYFTTSESWNFRMYTLSGNTLGDNWAIALWELNRLYNKNHIGICNKLRQMWKQCQPSGVNFWYYNWWNTTLQTTSINVWTNSYSNNNFPIRVDSQTIYKWLLTNMIIDIDTGVTSPIVSLLPAVWTWVSRAEYWNDIYCLQLKTWNFYIFQITASGTALQFKSSWFVETIDYSIPAWFTRFSLSAIENLNGQTAVYQVSFNNWVTWIWVTLNQFVLLPTSPYPTQARVKVTLSTANPTQSPIVDKINLLLHN